MALKSHAKLEEKPTCGLENEMESLANFHQNTWKCQNRYFHGILLPEVKYVWAKKCVMTLKNDEKSEEEFTCHFKISIKKFDKFWFEHSKVLKIYTLMGCFWPKYIMFELKKYRGVIFNDTREWCKIWSKTDLWFGKWHKKFGKFSPEH